MKEILLQFFDSYEWLYNTLPYGHDEQWECWNNYQSAIRESIHGNS